MRFLAITSFLLLTNFSFSQILSEQAEISIITCGPGQEELYTAFGHSAIRIYDPVKNLDLAYNYGVFNFNQPNFYLNFARGFLYYKLDVDHYRNFEYPYVYFNRYVHQQVLNLSHNQKNAIFRFLMNNARPENQYYRYDYFYNNCATKMRDVIKAVLKDSVIFDGSHINTNYTIRELTDLYLTNQPWGDFGIDICLGLPMDKVAEPIEYMFLPEYVEAGFNNAFIIRNGVKEPLVQRRETLYESLPENVEETLISPLYLFSLLFIIFAVVSWRDLRRRKITMWLDAGFFTILGAIGLLLLLLWVATDHNAAAKNLNLLFAIPFHLIAVAAFIRQPKWLKQYFLVVAVLSVALLIFWSVLPQQLHYALIPIVMISALRSYVQYKLRS